MESTLAQIYKVRDPRTFGFRGGPAYYIRNCLGSKSAAALFAVLISVTFGLCFNSVQANTITLSLESTFGLDRALGGACITILSAIVIFGGLKRIGHVSAVLAPFMGGLYILGGFVLLVLLIYLGVLYDTQVNDHEDYLAQSIRTIAREEKVDALFDSMHFVPVPLDERLGGTAQAPELFYEERDAVYHLAVGLEAPVRQSLLFRGNAFQVAVQGRFTHDDEENPVLRIQIDFLETPSTRILKLILTPQGPRLTQDETPGAAFVTAMANDMGESAAFRALAAALVGTPDPAYLRYRIGRMFRPDLALTAEALE